MNMMYYVVKVLGAYMLALGMYTLVWLISDPIKSWWICAIVFFLAIHWIGMGIVHLLE